MSKDIVIQESGEPKTLSAISRIETNLYDGGTVGWVLDEGLDLAEKTITKNGTYKASNDGAYAYAKLVVKVPNKDKKKKKGKKPRGSGDPNDYSVTTDDDRNLVYTKLPTSINIINPPSKTVYNDGELVKKQGMLVKAYFADGGLWGDVPLGEITLDPDRAHASEQSEMWSDGHGINAIRTAFSYGTKVTPDGANEWTGVSSNISIPYDSAGHAGICYLALNNASGAGDFYLTRFNGDIFAARITGQENTGGLITLRTLWNRSYNYFYWYGASTTGIVENTFTWTGFEDNIGGHYYPIPESTVSPDGVSPSTLHPVGQKITAKWPRPEDGKILTDIFSITVNSSS